MAAFVDGTCFAMRLFCEGRLEMASVLRWVCFTMVFIGVRDGGCMAARLLHSWRSLVREGRGLDRQEVMVWAGTFRR